MRIAIFGAGSTGCYVGGLLQLCGHHVTFICRERVRNAIVEAGGITLTDYAGQCEKLMPAAMITQLADEQFDVVFITLKCHQLEGALANLQRLAQNGAELFFMQNGLDSLAPIAQQLPHEKVKQGITPFNVLSQPRAHFHRGTEGTLIFQKTPSSKQFARELCAIGFPAEVYADMRPIIYGKLLLNLNNAFNAIANQPIKTQLENRALRKVLAAAQREWLAVAQCEGIELAQFTAVKPAWMPVIMSLPNWIFLRMAKAMLQIDPQARSSMWEDIQAGRKTEIEYLNQAVVVHAEKLGIDAPVNRQISAMIVSLEKGEEVALTQLCALAS